MLRFLIWSIIILGLLGGGYYVLNQPPPQTPNSQTKNSAPKQGSSGLIDKLLDRSLTALQSRLNLPNSNADRRPPIPDRKSPIANRPVNQLETATSTEAQALKQYLINSSNIGFPEPIDVSVAVIAARNNDFSRLESLIADFKAKQAEFLKIKAPEVAKQIHQRSTEITQNYIQLLEQAYNSQAPQQVEKILNSPEADQLRAQAQAVISQIQELVNQFNIQLPAEVIPAQPQSLDSSRYEIGADFKKNSLENSLINFLAPPKIAYIGGADETAGTTEELLAHSGANDCPLNDEPTDQCGGGEFPREGIGNCPRPVVLAYYTNCNYGNAPNILGQEQSLHPLDPEPACSAVDNTPACACLPTPTPGCGVVLRLYPPGCVGCCPPLPVSAEQCCGGSAWLWDKVTGWVGCAELR